MTPNDEREMNRRDAFRWIGLAVGGAGIMALLLFAGRFIIFEALYPELFVYTATSPDGLYAHGRGTKNGVVYTYVAASATQDGALPPFHGKAGDLSIVLGEVILPQEFRANGGYSVAGTNGELQWTLASATGRTLVIHTDRANVVQSIGIGEALAHPPAEFTPKIADVEVPLRGEPVIPPFTEQDVERLFGENAKVTRHVSP